MTPEKKVIDLHSSVKDHLSWVNEEVFKNIGLYAEVCDEPNEFQPLGSITFYDEANDAKIFNFYTKKIRKSIYMEIVGFQGYSELEPEQKIVAKSYLGKLVMDNPDWEYLFLDPQFMQNSKDRKEISYFFESLNSPTNQFVSYLSADRIVFRRLLDLGEHSCDLGANFSLDSTTLIN